MCTNAVLQDASMKAGEVAQQLHGQQQILVIEGVEKSPNTN